MGIRLLGPGNISLHRSHSCQNGPKGLSCSPFLTSHYRQTKKSALCNTGDRIYKGQQKREKRRLNEEGFNPGGGLLVGCQKASTPNDEKHEPS